MLSSQSTGGTRMTRTLTRSATQLAATMIAAIVLSECAGSSDGPDAAPRTSAAPTAEAPRTYTTDQLAAALPRTSQVPGAKDRSATCPGDPACAKGTVAETLTLDQRDIAGQERAKNQFLDDFVSVAATAH